MKSGIKIKKIKLLFVIDYNRYTKKVQEYDSVTTLTDISSNV